MLFSWFARRRRKKIRRAGVPKELLPVLRENLWQFDFLTAQQQDKLEGDAAVLFAEKNWEGCGGQEMNDRVRISVAAHMALLTLGLRDQYFDRVLSVLLYPDAYRVPETVTRPGGVVVHRESTRLGEAWHRGPVVLSWADVLEAGQGPNCGRSIVAHEFAHQLDMLNGGHADGVPLIASAAQAERWIQVLDACHRRLRRECRGGGAPVLDCYGATNRSEFFSVASEAFFQTPEQIAWNERELYDVMSEYYGVEPLKWVR